MRSASAESGSSLRTFANASRAGRLSRNTMRNARSTGVDALLGETAPLEVDAVHLHDARGVAVREREGRGVLHQPRHAADHHRLADAHELLHGDAAGEIREVLDDHVAREHDVVRHDHVAADVAVVADVHVHEQQVVVADARGAAARRRAGMDRDLLADHVARADREPRGLALVLHVLRDLADGGEREDHRARAHLRVARDHRVRAQARRRRPAARSDRRRRTDRSRRPRRAPQQDRRPSSVDALHASASVSQFTNAAKQDGLGDGLAADRRGAREAHHLRARRRIGRTNSRSTSPGTTWRRKRVSSTPTSTVFMPRFSGIAFTAQMPPACAIASMISTPGKIG